LQSLVFPKPRFCKIPCKIPCYQRKRAEQGGLCTAAPAIQSGLPKLVGWMVERIRAVGAFRARRDLQSPWTQAKIPIRAKRLCAFPRKFPFSRVSEWRLLWCTTAWPVWQFSG